MLAHIAPLVRKARERHGHAFHIDRKRSWPIEHVNVRVRRETKVRDTRAFVVARNDGNRYAPLGDSPQRLECLIADRTADIRMIEDIATVHDEIHLAAKRGLQRASVVGEEVVSSAVAVDAGPLGQVEPQVGIGEEQDAQRMHAANVSDSVFLR